MPISACPFYRGCGDMTCPPAAGALTRTGDVTPSSGMSWRVRLPAGLSGDRLKQEKKKKEKEKKKTISSRRWRFWSRYTLFHPNPCTPAVGLPVYPGMRLIRLPRLARAPVSGDCGPLAGRRSQSRFLGGPGSAAHLDELADRAPAIVRKGRWSSTVWRRSS